jgi:hypothetical protein
MVDIITAINDEKLFKPVFRDLATWSSWQVFLKAITGLPLSDEELPLFQQCTGLREPPEKPPREVFCISGRRSGKSFVSALLAVYLSYFRGWSEVLAPGEKGYFAVIASDRRQARIVMDYIKAFLHASPLIENLINEELKEEVSLKNRITIDVKTASFRTIRGFTLIGAIMEELAFWRTEDAAEPDHEIYRAIVPALATTGGLLIGISTPYARRGLLWEKFSKHFGKPGETLIWKAETLTMNPTIKASIIEQALIDDPQAAAAEWKAEFRADIEQFISLDVLNACVIPGRQFLPPDPSKSYIGFIDPSGGSNDSFTLAIAHCEGEKIILDQILERRPPFSPQDVVREFAAILRQYNIRSVISDRYAGEWVREAFIKEGIGLDYSELTASELYLETLPLLAAGRVELPDHPRLLNQFSSLERRVRAGGKDLITHPPGGHDDLANSVSGSVYYSNKTGRHFFRIWLPIADMPTETALSFMSGKK